MIITTESTATNNSGFTSTSFSMKQSAHAFKILTTSLYTNKERAVLREYFANAYDANVAAGSTDPVRIQLPTQLEPNLVISDNGTGMDVNQLTRLYTTFFESSKQSSNDAIGGFGIGSKSGFALSETFTVTSVKDNQSTTIVAYIDGGIPKLVTTDKSYTDSPNGTTVTIPISSKGVQQRLADEAYSLFTYVPIQPIITLGSTSHFKLKANALSTAYNNCYIVDGYGYGYDYLCNVISGVFSYQLPESLLTRIETLGGSTYASLKKDLSAYRFSKAFMFVTPVGTLELSPSRETIEDTLANAQVILDLFYSTANQVIADIKQKTQVVYNLLKEFITADVSTYDQLLAERQKILNKVPKVIFDSIDKHLYYEGFENNSVVLAIHKHLATSAWFRVDGAGSLCKAGNVFDDNKWLRILNLYDITSKQIQISYSKAKAVHHRLCLDNLPYIANVEGAALSRLYNSGVTELTYDNQTVSVRNIYAIPDEVQYNRLVAALGSHCVQLPKELFSTKRTRTVTTPGTKTPIAKTPIADITTFNVLFDSTHTHSGVVGVDFYNTNYGNEAYVVVLKYSKQPDTKSWSNIPSFHFSPTPVIVLQELRSGEHLTKRFQSFVADKQVQVLSSDATYAYLSDYHTKDLASDLPELTHFYRLSQLLSIPKVSYDSPAKLSKFALYRFVARFTQLKYYRMLLPRKSYQAVFNRIWKAYAIGLNLDRIIMNALGAYHNSYVLTGLSMAVNYSIFEHSCAPLIILQRTDYYNNVFDWVLSQPGAIDEIKSTINPYLGVTSCLSHT